LRTASVATSVGMRAVGLQTDCIGQTPSRLNRREGSSRRAFGKPGVRCVSDADGHRHRQRCGCAGGRGGSAERGDAFGESFVLARNPGGEPSPWKERADGVWQQTVFVTDPPVEQGLEVEGRRIRAAVMLVGSGGATTRGQRSQRCACATGGGTSSRGVKDAAGKVVGQLGWRLVFSDTGFWSR
jgi:hypothetical protein